MEFPPAISSTGIHVAEMFTTGYRYFIIDLEISTKTKLRHLLIPGVLGSNPARLIYCLMLLTGCNKTIHNNLHDSFGLYIISKALKKISLKRN